MELIEAVKGIFFQYGHTGTCQFPKIEKHNISYKLLVASEEVYIVIIKYCYMSIQLSLICE